MCVRRGRPAIAALTLIERMADQRDPCSPRPVLLALTAISTGTASSAAAIAPIATSRNIIMHLSPAGASWLLYDGEDVAKIAGEQEQIADASRFGTSLLQHRMRISGAMNMLLSRSLTIIVLLGTLLQSSIGGAERGIHDIRRDRCRAGHHLLCVHHPISGARPAEAARLQRARRLGHQRAWSIFMVRPKLQRLEYRGNRQPSDKTGS